MSEPFLGDIKIVGFNFPPRGFAQCDGQLLPINQYQALFSLLGTTFGGDGRTSFGLPDLRGRTPLHFDGSHPWGLKTGQPSVTLTPAHIPSHSHGLNASSDNATETTPTDNLPATVVPGYNVYGSTANANGNAGQVANSGGNASHNNMQPYQTLNFVIAISGLFPSRN